MDMDGINMKKLLLHIFGTALSLILLFVTATGCDTKDNTNEDLPEFVFVPEFTSLSAFTGNLPNVNNIVLTESAIFFTSTSNIDSTSLFRTTSIYRIDLDKSDLANLSNYTSLLSYTSAPPPPAAEGGGVYITAIHIDGDGDLWVAETYSYVTFDFPHNFDINDADENEIWEHHKPLETNYRIRKLDSIGAEQLSIDINSLASETQYRGGTNAIYVDENDNIFIGYGQTIFILNADGSMQFNLDTDDFIFCDSESFFIHGNYYLRRSGKPTFFWTFRRVLFAT